MVSKSWSTFCVSSAVSEQALLQCVLTAEIFAGSMSWWTYVWYLVWLVISAGVYCLYSIRHVEVPYEAIDSPVQRPVPSPCLCCKSLAISPCPLSLFISCVMSPDLDSHGLT